MKIKFHKPQSSSADDALIIIDEYGRIFVGDDVLFDAIDGMGDGDDDETGGCGAERI
jgi:hypothetical protein